MNWRHAVLGLVGCLLPAFGQTGLSGNPSFAHFTYGKIASPAGSYWKTSFLLMDVSGGGSTATLHFYHEDGTDFAVPMVGKGRAATFAISVPANGMVRVDLDETADNESQGWVQVDADNTGGISSGLRLQGLFKQHVPGRPDFEAVVPVTDRSMIGVCVMYIGTPRLVIPFDNTSGYTTSVAFTNVTATAADLQLQFLDGNGNTLYSTTKNILGKHHTAYPTNAGEFAGMAGKKGTIVVSSNADSFAGIGFMFNSTGPFTTLIPVIE